MSATVVVIRKLSLCLDLAKHTKVRGGFVEIIKSGFIATEKLGPVIIEGERGRKQTTGQEHQEITSEIGMWERELPSPLLCNVRVISGFKSKLNYLSLVRRWAKK